MKIYVDVHGVLVDFVKQCEIYFNADIYSDPQYEGDWYAPQKVIPDLLQKIERAGDGFWSEMPLTPWAHDLIALCAEYGQVVLVTSGECPSAYHGVCELVEREFDIPLFTGEHKWALAQSDAVLIDDKESNIESFDDNGGHGILFPAPWNKETKNINLEWLLNAAVVNAKGRAFMYDLRSSDASRKDSRGGNLWGWY